MVAIACFAITPADRCPPGDNWDMADVPLGESNEAYRIRVRKDGAILREETVSEPSWDYSAGLRASDGVTVPFTVEIAQISDLYGPGNEARISINA